MQQVFATFNSGPDFLRAAFLSCAALLGAAIFHWTLRRLSRRLPRTIAQRLGWSLTLGMQAPWQGVLELVLLIPKIAVWLGVTVFVSEQFSPLRHARALLAHLVEMSVTMPLFALSSGRGYSALDVLALPVVLALLCVAVSVFTRGLKTHVLSATGMERGAQEAVALLARYALIFLGAIVVLQIWGIDASSLALVASVLGVGIGFGLQHIANNFVSGLVISLERPIQPGDFVKVGEWTGTVEKIGPRHTEIRTLDNVSILVPNSRFLETEVVNWSHGDPLSRIQIPVGVAYGSDMVHARTALLESAQSHPDVLRDPRPTVELHAFGDSALECELNVWTRDPRNQIRLRSDLNFRIEANLRRYGIQVPFPQRDLHLRSPQLDQILAAWSRRQFSEAELAPSNDSEPVDLPETSLSGSQVPTDDRGPRAWSDETLRAVVQRMRGADGISTSDRRHLLTVYRRCFVGREAVDWMTHALGLTRIEAVELGQRLMERGAMHHVLDEHGFKDGHFFYRFRADGVGAAAGEAAPMDVREPHA